MTQNKTAVTSVRALPEKAKIMIRRKFCGSLTFHKVIMGNNMKMPSTERSTVNNQDNRLICGGEITTHRHSQLHGLRSRRQSYGNVGQQSHTKVRRLGIRK